MLKLIAFLGSFYTLLFLNFVLGDGTAIDFITPPEADAGKKITVSATIKRGDVTGFARFQQELPHGIKVEKVEAANADFTFRNHTIKFIWVNLPLKDEIKITYTLEFDERLTGQFDMTGTFSFIANNQRKKVHITPTALKINPNPNLAYHIDINKFRDDFSYEDYVDRVACIRQKPYLNENNDYVVNLLVYKKDIEKYAKIEEKLPSGYGATAQETKNPIFTANNQTAKFIWMDLPQKKYFVTTYKLLPGDQIEPLNLKGEFSYIESGNTKIIDIIERGDIDLTNTDEAYLEGIIRSSMAAISKTPVRDGGRASSGDKDKTLDEIAAEGSRLNPVLDPDQGVYYRVQLAAGHNPVNIEKYFKKYKLKHEVKSESHDGWIKYSIGAFTVYKDARDYRVYIWRSTPINDAFVAAYNNGIRITVQEALMIANHKWYR